MSEGDHGWCRDVRRDEAIRAAEDAAAVPSIQHRDLPEVVAALTERVARLEAAQATLGSGDVYADVGCGSTGDEIARLTAERDAAIRERDAAKKECNRLSAANYALDGAVTALESRVSELKKELKLAKEANAGGFSKQPAASGAGKSAEGGNQEPVKYAVVVGGEMKNTVYDNFGEARYKASEIACRGVPHFVGVVALYREPPRPAGWLTDEDRRAVAFAAKVFRGHTIVGPLKQNADQLDALLARETPPMVRRPNLNVVITTVDARERIDRQWIAAIRAAGGEVE